MNEWVEILKFTCRFVCSLLRTFRRGKFRQWACHRLGLSHHRTRPATFCWARRVGSPSWKARWADAFFRGSMPCCCQRKSPSFSCKAYTPHSFRSHPRVWSHTQFHWPLRPREVLQIHPPRLRFGGSLESPRSSRCFRVPPLLGRQIFRHVCSCWLDHLIVLQHQEGWSHFRMRLFAIQWYPNLFTRGKLSLVSIQYYLPLHWLFSPLRRPHDPA